MNRYKSAVLKGIAVILSCAILVSELPGLHVPIGYADCRPQHSPDSAVLYEEHFEDGDVSDWSFSHPWELQEEESNVYLYQPNGNAGFVTRVTPMEPAPSYTNLTMEADIALLERFNINASASLFFRTGSNQEGYVVQFTERALILQKRAYSNGALATTNLIWKPNAVFADGKAHHVKVDAYNDQIQLYIDGKSTGEFAVKPDSTFQSGTIGFGTFQAKMRIDNLIVREALEPETFEQKDARLNQWLSCIETKREQLQSRLDQFHDLAKQPLQAHASMQIVDLYQGLIPAFRSDYIDVTLKQAQGVVEVIDDTMAKLDRNQYFLADPNSPKLATGLVPRNGHFYNIANEPVFVRGIGGSINLQKDLSLTNEEYYRIHNQLGLNLINGFFRGLVQFYPNDNEVLSIPSGPDIFNKTAIEQAYANNIMSTILWSAQSFPSWLQKNYPEAMGSYFEKENHFIGVDPDHPKVRELIDRYIEANMNGLMTDANPDILEKAVLGFTLHNEPRFGSISDQTISVSLDDHMNFIEFLTAKYGTVQALNEAWGTQYTSFDALNAEQLRSLLASEPPRPYYDWSSYNFTRFTNHFQWFGDRMRHYERILRPNSTIGTRTSIKLDEGKTMLTAKDYNRFSRMDLEQLSQATSLHGSDIATKDIVGSHYNMDWVSQSYLFDFQKSIDPSKPFYDSEWHPVETVGYQNPELKRDYMRQTIRLAAWHGMTANLLWVYTNPKSSFYNPATLMTQPLVLNEYITEAMAIDREMERIVPFSQAKRHVYILQSMSSVLYDKNDYLSELQKAYEAFSFEDVSIGILTEQMLEDDARMSALDLDLLVVPNARHMSQAAYDRLKSKVTSGLRTVVIGEAPSLNEHHQPLQGQELQGHVVHLPKGSLDEYRGHTAGLMHWSGAERPYTLLNEGAKHPDFIEARFTEVNGKKFGYAINMGNLPQRFVVVDTSSGQAAVVKELVQSEPGPSRTFIELAPREYVSFDIVGSTALPYAYTWQQYIAALPQYGPKDTSPPTGSITVREGVYTNQRDLTVTLTALDDQGAVPRMRLSSDGVSWGPWESFQSSKAYTLSGADTDGEYKVFVQFEDAANNVSQAYSAAVQLDTTAPISSLSYDPAMGRNGWHTTAPTLLLTAADSLSGVAQTVYRVADSDWTPYSGPLTLLQSGAYAVQYQSTDLAGNMELPRAWNTQIDLSGPVLEVKSPQPNQVVGSSGTLTLDYTATDDASGVDLSSLTAILDGRRSLAAGERLALYGLALGEHSMIVQGQDRAGHQTTVTVTFRITASEADLRGLIEMLTDHGEIHKGFHNSLLAKVNSGSLQALVNQLEAQSGKQITTYAADILLRNAAAVIRELQRIEADHERKRT